MWPCRERLVTLRLGLSASRVGRDEPSTRCAYLLKEGPLRGRPLRAWMELVPMLRRPLIAVGACGIAAVALYIGATVLGGILDPQYSQVHNAVSELTGSEAPNREVLAPLYIVYNVMLFGFAYALFRASSGGRLFKVGVVLFAIGGLSGIGQVTFFRMDTVGTAATTAGTMHLVLAGVSPLLCVATAILYGFAFRREATFRGLSTYSFAAAVLLVLTAPAAVAGIDTDVMGLFERITIGVFMLWVVVVSAHSLLAARHPLRVGLTPMGATLDASR